MVHTDVPAVNALYAPVAQLVHTVDVLAAATLPYLPAAHAVHTADVCAAATLP